MKKPLRGVWGNYDRHVGWFGLTWQISHQNDLVYQPQNDWKTPVGSWETVWTGTEQGAWACWAVLGMLVASRFGQLVSQLFWIFGTLGSVCWSGHDAPASRLIRRKSDISFKDSKRHKMPQRIRESLTRDRSLFWKFTKPLEAAGSSCVSSAAQLLVTGVIEQLRPRQTNYSVNEKCERLIDFLAWSPPGLRLSEAEPLT